MDSQGTGTGVLLISYALLVSGMSHFVVSVRRETGLIHLKAAAKG